MNINISYTTSESIPIEKINKIILNVITEMIKQDGWENGISVTECIRNLNGNVVGWVELIAE